MSKLTLPSRNRWLLAAALLPLLGACGGRSAEPAPPATERPVVPPAVADIEADPVPTDRLRVLFIGNSYTYVNDLPMQVQRIAESADAELSLEVVSVTPGGMTLEHHWTDGVARRLIRQGGWTHVVLQEQSTRPIDDPALFRQYARMFDEEIDRVGAKTVFYLTWARQHRPASQDTLSHEYLTAAAELSASVAPVGMAWQRALEEDPSLVLHHEDRSHPGPTGTYVAALVLYATLFDASPVGVTPARWDSSFGATAPNDPERRYSRKPAEEIEPLRDATAAMLQRIARDVVEEAMASPASTGTSERR
ncbi:MAG: hypothetical protein OEU54_04595 [Gemmatimonadota bacterium]|nr:hypothetical protein [Gemmatimonadota bacterium]